MLTICDIRKYMAIWKQQTYRSGLEYCYSIKKEKTIYDLTVEVLQLQKLDNKLMDGYSVQNIPHKKEAVTPQVAASLFVSRLSTTLNFKL